MRLQIYELFRNRCITLFKKYFHLSQNLKDGSNNDQLIS